MITALLCLCILPALCLVLGALEVGTESYVVLFVTVSLRVVPAVLGCFLDYLTPVCGSYYRVEAGSLYPQLIIVLFRLVVEIIVTVDADDGQVYTAITLFLACCGRACIYICTLYGQLKLPRVGPGFFFEFKMALGQGLRQPCHPTRVNHRQSVLKDRLLTISTPSKTNEHYIQSVDSTCSNCNAVCSRLVGNRWFCRCCDIRSVNVHKQPITMCYPSYAARVMLRTHGTILIVRSHAWAREHCLLRGQCSQRTLRPRCSNMGLVEREHERGFEEKRHTAGVFRCAC